jgi:hypothetical protein
MKLTENVKSTLAFGFSKTSDSLGGEKTLGFFGSREIVSFSVNLLEFACSTIL